MFLPETLHLAQKRRLPTPEVDDESISQVSANSGKPKFTWERTKATVASWLHHVTHAVDFIRRSRIVGISVIACFAFDFGRGSLLFVLQYISERYSLTLSQTNYLMSIKAFVNLIFFTVLLPTIDVFMVTKLHISPQRKDLSLAKASMILIAASFVILAFAPSVWLIVVAVVLYAAGCGFGSFVRSLLSSLLVPDMLGTLYMILSVVDTLSGLLSGPLCAEALKLGIRLQGFWHGLPYLLSAVLCIFAGCLMFAVTIEHGVKGNEEEPLLRE